MTDIAELALSVNSRGVKTASKDLDKLSRQSGETERKTKTATEKMNASFKKTGSAVNMLVGAMVALGAVRIFTGAIRESMQMEKQLNIMDQLVKQTGASAWTTTQQLQQQAHQVALNTLESVDGVMEAQKTLLTFRKVTGEVFDRSIQAAADMSAALGTDLRSSVLQLGKALEDPVTGMSALSRSGTVFTEQQKEMVKSMVESGKQAEAQKFILSELEAQYGGAGNAAAKGLAGALDTLSQRWQEFQLAITSGKGGAIETIINGISNSIHFVTENMHVARRVVIALMSQFHVFGVRVGAQFDILREEMKFALSNPLDFAKGKIADFLEWISDLGSTALKFLGLGDLAASLPQDFSHLRSATVVEHNKMLAEMRAKTDQEVSAIKSIYADMFADAGRAPAIQAPTGSGIVNAVMSTGGVDEEASKIAAKNEQKFLAMAEGFRTEMELINIQEEERLMILENQFMNTEMAWIDHEDYKTAIIAEAAQERMEIADRAAQHEINARQAATNAGLDLLNTLASKSKSWAKVAVLVNGALSMSQAIQNTAVGATRAIAELGPIAGPPAAKAIWGYGKIQMGLIAANTALKLGGAGSSSGSSGSSPSIGTPVTTQQAPARAQQDLVIRREGSSIWTDDMVESLLSKVGDYSRDNDIALGDVRFA